MLTHTYPLFSVDPPKYPITNNVNHDAASVAHGDKTHNSTQEQAPTSAIHTAEHMSYNTNNFKRRATKRYLARKLKRKTLHKRMRSSTTTYKGIRMRSWRWPSETLPQLSLQQ